MMNKLMQLGVMFCVLVLMVLVFGEVAAAQGLPGPPQFPIAPDPAPVDGGLVLLAAAGGAYAYRKLRGQRK